ncbi:MAG: glycosidase [Rhodothermia bacterium]|nr:MAG: glycosidase [Rhodothermia bacterium]
MVSNGFSDLGVRMISTPPPISPERLYDGRPVLESIPAHGWERRVVLNPAAALIEHRDEMEALFDSWRLTDTQRHELHRAGGACVLLYRAQGNVDPATQLAPSFIGMAVCTPMLGLVYRRSDPVLEPIETFHDLGVEDPRCTKVGDTYFLHYTGYYSIGSKDQISAGRTHICLATSTDFVRWDLHGPVPGDVNIVLNKNAALFPGQMEGRWFMMHRPMEGPDAMVIHLAEADSPYGPWKTAGVMMRSYTYREFERTWIGAGGPPYALGDGRFLVIYHVGHRTFDGAREYDLAAALVDLTEEPVVRGRIEPLMRPVHSTEQVGDPDLGVDNVLFSCANYRWGEQLIIPYAGADSRICGATVSIARLVSELESRSPE